MTKAKKRPVRKAASKPKAAPVSVRDLSRDLARVKKLVVKAKLAGVEEGLSYGQPSLKVADKFWARVREPDVLVLVCALEEKDFLMQMNGEMCISRRITTKDGRRCLSDCRRSATTS